MPDRRMIVESIVPLVQVGDVQRSIAFYRKLGFSEQNTYTPDGDTGPAWASLKGDGAQLMLGRASAPVDARKQAVLFYLYVPDVATARAALIEAGVDAGPIRTPFYAPRGEFEVVDPDGYVLMISHT